MRIVKVTYIAKADYVAQNQANIQAVMADLQKINNPGINYNCCLGPDGQTFIHSSFMQSDEEQKMLNELPSFIYFQQQLKAHGLETPPKQEFLTLVGTSKPIFDI